MKNIELKIILNNPKNILSTLKNMGAKNKGILYQVDTYFNTQNGRLKTREINNKDFELIYYQRPNVGQSKISDYQIIKLSLLDGHKLIDALKKTNEVKVIVKKERNLWISKNTRIHIDKVKNLGNFLELETVIDKIDKKMANKEHAEIVALLNINNEIKVNESYSDLLLCKV